jgi:hypothetical protein
MKKNPNYDQLKHMKEFKVEHGFPLNDQITIDDSSEDEMNDEAINQSIHVNNNVNNNVDVIRENEPYVETEKFKDKKDENDSSLLDTWENLINEEISFFNKNLNDNNNSNMNNS